MAEKRVHRALQRVRVSVCAACYKYFYPPKGLTSFRKFELEQMSVPRGSYYVILSDSRVDLEEESASISSSAPSLTKGFPKYGIVILGVPDPFRK